MWTDSNQIDVKYCDYCLFQHDAYSAMGTVMLRVDQACMHPYVHCWENLRTHGVCT